METESHCLYSKSGFLHLTTEMASLLQWRMTDYRYVIWCIIIIYCKYYIYCKYVIIWLQICNQMVQISVPSINNFISYLQFLIPEKCLGEDWDWIHITILLLTNCRITSIWKSSIFLCNYRGVFNYLCAHRKPELDF